MDNTLKLLYDRYANLYNKWRTAPDFSDEDIAIRLDLWVDYTRARDAYESYMVATQRKGEVSYIPVVTSVQ